MDRKNIQAMVGRNERTRAPPLQAPHVVTVFQPSIKEKGMSTILLQRLHFNSSPAPLTLAIN
jgi:hypothetical protein